MFQIIVMVPMSDSQRGVTYTSGKLFVQLATITLSTAQKNFNYHPRDHSGQLALVHSEYYSRFNCLFSRTRSIWKMLGPFATASRRTPVLHCHSPGVATAACHLRYRCPQQRQCV